MTMAKIRNMEMWKKVLLGMVLGIAVGTISAEAGSVLKPIGTIFINLIKMLVIPLVFFSLISGVTSLKDPEKMGRIGIKTFLLYFATTIFAVSIGLMVAGIIKPGAGVNLPDSGIITAAEPPTLAETFINIIPTNPIASLAEGNILQIIFFAVFLGLAAASLRQRAAPFVEFSNAMAEIMYKITDMVMKFAPIGVFALMAWVAAEYGIAVLMPLLKLALAVVVASVLHILIVYRSIIKYLLRLSPALFFRKMANAQMVAFTTSSSAATLPVTMKVAKEKLGVSNETASFVLPLGATINMDGTSIYLGICTLFVAQAVGVDLTLAQYVTVLITSLLISIGVAGIPGGGLAMLTLVLHSVGLPLEGVALIAGVDRILDMIRTMVNVTGDAVVTLYVDKAEGKFNESVYAAAG